MNFFTAYEEKLSVNPAADLQDHKIVVKINESLLYNRSFGKMERDLFFRTRMVVYQNGYLNESLHSFSGAFYGTNEFHLIANISSYRAYQAGEYVVIVHTNALLVLLFNECPLDIVLSLLDYLSTSRIILLVETLQLQTAGK